MTDANATPILVLGYRRPALLKRLLSHLHANGARNIFISIDKAPEGDGGLAEANQACRDIADKARAADTRTSVRLATSHEGCALGVYEGITWFLRKVPMGIILEDDVDVTPGLLEFLSEHLVRLQQDRTIFSLSGFNWTPEHNISDPQASYYLSRYVRTFGWATWADRWEGFSLDSDCWWGPGARSTLMMYGGRRFQRYWTHLVEETLLTAGLDTWDIQWASYIWKHGGLNAVSTKNLTRHLGFGPDATHTRGEHVPEWHPKVLHSSSEVFRRPTPEVRDPKADRWADSHYFPIGPVASVRSKIAQWRDSRSNEIHL